MTEKKVPYEYGGRKFEGMLVYDDSVKAKRPAIFMQPDWKGVCPDTIAQARIVAGKDYVVMMADMFGAGYGDKPKAQPELAAAMRAVHDDLPFTIGCGGKAYEALLAAATTLGLLDPAKTVAIGYCAGGGYALEQARAGADFKALVVFHVTNPNPVQAGHAVQHQGPRARHPRLGRSGDAQAHDGRVRGRAHQRQGRLAGDDVRRCRALVLRPDRPCGSDALRREALSQVLRDDARLLRRDAVRGEL